MTNTYKKLTAAQADAILKRLEVKGQQLLEAYEEMLEEQLIPQRLTEADMRQQLVKLAYDEPDVLVGMCMELITGRAERFKFVVDNLEKRSAAFDNLAEIKGTLRGNLEEYLSRTKCELLFQEFEQGQYPLVLETDLEDAFKDWLGIEESEDLGI